MEFLSQIIIDYKGEEISVQITVEMIIWIFFVIVLASVLSWLVRKIIKRMTESTKPVTGFVKRLFLFIQLFIWIGVSAVVLIILDLPFKEVLDYPLIKGKEFVLQPVHFFYAALIVVATRIPREQNRACQV